MMDIESFQLTRPPRNMDELKEEMRRASDKASEEGKFVMMGMCPHHLGWEHSIPMVFSAGNLHEAVECARMNLEKIRNRIVLLGEVFPSIQMYLVLDNYAEVLLHASGPTIARPIRDVHWIMRNLGWHVNETKEKQGPKSE